MSCSVEHEMFYNCEPGYLMCCFVSFLRQPSCSICNKYHYNVSPPVSPWLVHLIFLVHVTCLLYRVLLVLFVDCDMGLVARKHLY